MEIELTALRTIQNLHLKRGSTIYPYDGGDAFGGYFVAQAGTERIFVGGITRSDVREYLNDYSNVFLLNDNAYFGAWEEGEKVYLDISFRFNDEDEAYAFAVKNNQIAFWNNYTQTTFYL